MGRSLFDVGTDVIPGAIALAGVNGTQATSVADFLGIGGLAGGFAVILGNDGRTYLKGRE